MGAALMHGHVERLAVGLEGDAEQADGAVGRADGAQISADPVKSVADDQFRQGPADRGLGVDPEDCPEIGRGVLHDPVAGDREQGAVALDATELVDRFTVAVGQVYLRGLCRLEGVIHSDVA